MNKISYLTIAISEAVYLARLVEGRDRINKNSHNRTVINANLRTLSAVTSPDTDGKLRRERLCCSDENGKGRTLLFAKVYY